MTFRVLMIAPTPYFSDRGCHVRIYEEARNLIALGHEVQICTYHLGRDMGGIPTDRIPPVPWYGKLSAGPSWHKPYLDILLFFKVLRIARRFRPHLMHAHLHEGAFLAAFLKPLLRVPVVFDCQGSLTGELVDHRFVREGSVLYRLFYLLENWINRRADHIVTSSTPTSELLREKFGLPATRVSPLIDGIPQEAPQQGRNNEELARQLGLPAEKRVVVFLGAMSEYQGVDLLLGAIRQISNRREDIHFLLMGYPEAGYLEKTRVLGISAYTTFTGKVPYHRAAAYLGLGDIAVSPKLSRSEANGKLFNYMACGLPTVVFDTPVNREILGDVGAYAAYGNAESLAAAIEGLIDDPQRLRTLATETRKLATTEHSWLRRGGEIVAVYRQLLSG